jgi:hypothetical protein
MDDMVAWHYDKKGVFSVKSAYHLGMNSRANQKGGIAASSTEPVDASPQWQKIWNINLPGKIKIFLWRFAYNSLPTRMNIQRKRVDLDTRCPMCYRLDEDGGHLFLKCKKVKQVWRYMHLEDVRLSLLNLASPLLVLEQVLNLPVRKRDTVLILLWDWWTTRNKSNAGELDRTIHTVCQTITRHVVEFPSGGVGIVSMAPGTNMNQQLSSVWTKPKENFTKVNFDAAFLESTGLGAWGFVARTDAGDFIAAAAGKLRHLRDALHAEAEACVAATEGAAALGLHRVVF